MPASELRATPRGGTEELRAPPSRSAPRLFCREVRNHPCGSRAGRRRPLRWKDPAPATSGPAVPATSSMEEQCDAGESSLEQQAETPAMLYAELLTHVHPAIAAQFELQTTTQLDADFGNSVPHWPAFADTADALRYLKTRYKLVILSNVDRAGFAASNRKLGVEFDAIYTAEDIGSYKPTPANFEYMLDHLKRDHGLGKADILHTAQSLFHDHAPARAFGLANAWIDRQRLSESDNWGATAKVEQRPEMDFLFFSMGEMAEAVRAERR